MAFCRTKKDYTVVLIGTPSNIKPWVWADKKHTPEVAEVCNDDGCIVFDTRAAIKQCAERFDNRDRIDKSFNAYIVGIAKVPGPGDHDIWAKLGEDTDTALAIVEAYEHAEKNYKKGDFNGLVIPVPISNSEFLTMSTLQAIRKINTAKKRKLSDKEGDEAHPAKKRKGASINVRFECDEEKWACTVCADVSTPGVDPYVW